MSGMRYWFAIKRTFNWRGEFVHLVRRAERGENTKTLCGRDAQQWTWLSTFPFRAATYPIALPRKCGCCFKREALERLGSGDL